MNTPHTLVKESFERKLKQKYNALTPLKRNGRKQLGDFATLDIESNNWTEYVVGGIYDGIHFQYIESIGGLIDALDRYSNYKFFAHFGGIFDFLYLINEYGLRRSIASDLILRGSSVFSFRINSNVFYDTSGIIPFSLEKAAKAFGVTHQKLEIDHSKRKTITPKLLKYLEHDCRALYEIIEKFYENTLLERTNFKPTLASTSLEVLRKYLTRPIPSINSESVDSFVREAYAGGRVEIFRPIYEQSETPLYYYDFNSLYPSVMRNMDVPGRVLKRSNRITELSFTECTVECPRGIYLPLLWKKTKNKFIFPRGKWRGVFPGLELIEAEKLGYKIHKIHKSIEFENLGPLFKEYIDDLYHIKNTDTDPVKKQISKLLLNAGYGRMAIKRDRESLCVDDGTAGITPLDIFIGDLRLGKKSNFYSGFSHAGIGALVTCHARIKLFRCMQDIQDSIFYCDTDSIITTRKIPTGTGLGELKLEATATRACFLLPKTYVFGSDVKMKGFPKEFAQSLRFQDFKSAMEGELSLLKTAMPGKMARIKSAKNNNGSILKVLNNSTREIRSKYDKRILYKKNGVWETKPLTINER